MLLRIKLILHAIAVDESYETLTEFILGDKLSTL